MSTHIAKTRPRSRMKIDVVGLARRGAHVSFEEAVHAALGNLKDFHLANEEVLLATYVAPETTAGGIILPDKSIEEDRFQGCIGLILKCGPLAFKYYGPYFWEGPKYKVGDYVFYRASEAQEVGIRGQSCRIINAQNLRMRVPNPSDIY